MMRGAGEPTARCPREKDRPTKRRPGIDRVICVADLMRLLWRVDGNRTCAPVVVRRGLSRATTSNHHERAIDLIGSASLAYI